MSNKIPYSSMTYSECCYFQSDGVRKPRCNRCEYISACEADYNKENYQYELFMMKKD